MYENGYDSLLKIVGMTKSQMRTLPRFKDGMVKRTYENIHNGLQGVKVSTVLGASGIFGHGIGQKRYGCIVT